MKIKRFQRKFILSKWKPVLLFSGRIEVDGQKPFKVYLRTTKAGRPVSLEIDNADVSDLLSEWYEKRIIKEAKLKHPLLTRRKKGIKSTKVIHWHRWSKNIPK